MKEKLNASKEENNMNVETIKAVGGLIAGMGASTVIGTAVRNVMGDPRNMNLVNKVTVTVGSAMMGALVGRKTMEFTEEYIDEANEMIVGLKEDFEWNKEQRKKAKEFKKEEKVAKKAAKAKGQ